MDVLKATRLYTLKTVKMDLRASLLTESELMEKLMLKILTNIPRTHSFSVLAPVLTSDFWLMASCSFIHFSPH